MGLFGNKEPKNKSNFFTGERLEEKAAKTMADVSRITGGISGQDQVRAILGAVAFPTVSSFLICTDDALVFSLKGNGLFQSSKYPFSSISGISMESTSPIYSCVTATIGGGESVIFTVEATRQDAQAFFTFASEKWNAYKSASGQSAAPAASAADEVMKFKQLLDAGAITQEEFDAKKKQLLGL